MHFPGTGRDDTIPALLGARVTFGHVSGEHWRADPVLRALAAAPFDDEPESDEECAVVEEARDAVNRGDVVSAAEVWRDR